VLEELLAVSHQLSARRLSAAAIAEDRRLAWLETHEKRLARESRGPAMSARLVSIY
jgi:hypothetical protein